MDYITSKKERRNIQYIVNWIQQNPRTEPNAYELVDVFTKYASIPKGFRNNVTEQNMEYLNYKRIQDFVRMKERFQLIQAFCKQAYLDYKSGVSHNKVECAYLRRLAGVQFYISQVKRDNSDYRFDNEWELFELTTYQQVIHQTDPEFFSKEIGKLSQIVHEDIKRKSIQLEVTNFEISNMIASTKEPINWIDPDKRNPKYQQLKEQKKSQHHSK